MTRRMKLSDVEAQTNYLIPRVQTTFQKAYPNVESIQIEVRPTGEGFEPFRGQAEWLEIYGENSFQPILNCRNPRCYGGGLQLDYLVRWSVVEAKLTEFATPMFCAGHEGSLKGRRNDGPCDTMFKVKISVIYKAQTETGADA